MAAAESMQAAGGKVFLDLGSPKPHLEKLLAHVDVVNCPERLIHRLFAINDLEEGAKRILSMGTSEVTITLGEMGAMHCTQQAVTHHKGYEVDAVDTNGAGDVFSGAMLYATLQGWESDRKLAFACAAAALKCQTLGNRDALPTLSQIELFQNDDASSKR